MDVSPILGIQMIHTHSWWSHEAEGAMMKAFVCIHGLLEEVHAGFGTEGTVWKAPGQACRETGRERA